MLINNSFFIKSFYIFALLQQQTKQVQVMKKYLILALFGLATIAVSSCGSGKANCDAYSDNYITIEENDLADNQ